MCKRGQVSIIRSDNGTNLVSADKELQAAMKQWDRAKIHDVMAQKGVRRIFNPPAGPHFGGVWERQVKTVKTVLKSVLPSLQACQKWNKVKQNLKPGEIVMILDDSAPRNTWLRGALSCKLNQTRKG